ncbi:GPI-ANCHORED PROTEIN [Salix viminalis]|uniref:GPI-ANCHORED PROTEIN n=1 Tax=Salix viminalis TaxID=40686 RepID=A0A9Q0NWA0_SALVM|nr:GPI-ANCHORED PROTEIN [Salix viminalis]
MSLNSITFLLLLTFFPLLLPGLPHPDPETIQPFKPNPSPPATIPAFPEQSSLAGCPLDLPNELFHGIKSACGSGSSANEHLHRTRCCPVLAAWLYSAYSATALSRASKAIPATATGRSPSYDMPLLPDDSETCVDGLSKGLKEKGIELVKPNETCDVVYCYCGIRLHPLSCPEAFSLNQKGELVGDKRVERLERNCLSNSKNVNGFPGLGGCSKCLHSLYLLNSNKTSNSSKSEDRSARMHNKDCQLMGLTWLLAKNRPAYIHTVTAVLRAMMMSTDGSDPRSCTLNSDGMPLAVDSSEISNNSLSISHQAPIYVAIAVICLLTFLLPLPSTRL